MNLDFSLTKPCLRCNLSRIYLLEPGLALKTVLGFAVAHYCITFRTFNQNLNQQESPPA